jgi:superfamily II DNA/RNA helicase
MHDHRVSCAVLRVAPIIPFLLTLRMQGIAKTGSGKTAAFVLPMIVHIMDQPELQKGEGPIGLVAAPTRELAEQIHKETRNFCKPYGKRLQPHVAHGSRRRVWWGHVHLREAQEHS